MIGTKRTSRRTCPVCNRFMSAYLTDGRDVCGYCGTEVDHTAEHRWHGSLWSAVLEWVVMGTEHPLSGDDRSKLFSESTQR